MRTAMGGLICGVNRPEMSGYYPMRFDGRWDRNSFQRYREAPSFNLKGNDVRLVDLNGNGVTEAIRSAHRLECYFSDSLEGWGETRRLAAEEFPEVDFADSRVSFDRFPRSTSPTRAFV